MLNTKYRWITRPQPFTSVKPDSNNNNHSQGDYVKRLSTNCSNQIPTSNGKRILSYNPYFRRIICTHTKPLDSYVPITSKQHTENLHTKCLLGEPEPINTILHGTPLPGGN
jgi:hypothetical protein